MPAQMINSVLYFKSVASQNQQQKLYIRKEKIEKKKTEKVHWNGVVFFVPVEQIMPWSDRCQTKCSIILWRHWHLIYKIFVISFICNVSALISFIFSEMRWNTDIYYSLELYFYCCLFSSLKTLFTIKKL